MMAYNIMKRLIKLNRKTKVELQNMCDVYYGVGRLTDDQYTELMKEIETLEE